MFPLERLFQVEPEGVGGNADFCFLVLGDTGEGGLPNIPCETSIYSWASGRMSSSW